MVFLSPLIIWYAFHHWREAGRFGYLICSCSPCDPPSLEESSFARTWVLQSCTFSTPSPSKPPLEGSSFARTWVLQSCTFSTPSPSTPIRGFFICQDLGPSILYLFLPHCHPPLLGGFFHLTGLGSFPSCSFSSPFLLGALFDWWLAGFSSRMVFHESL